MQVLIVHLGNSNEELCAALLAIARRQTLRRKIELTNSSMKAGTQTVFSGALSRLGTSGNAKFGRRTTALYDLPTGLVPWSGHRASGIVLMKQVLASA